MSGREGARRLRLTISAASEGMECAGDACPQEATAAPLLPSCHSHAPASPLVLVIHAYCHVGPPQEGLGERGAVAEAHAQLNQGGAGAQTHSMHALEHGCRRRQRPPVSCPSSHKAAKKRAMLGSRLNALAAGRRLGRAVEGVWRPPWVCPPPMRSAAAPSCGSLARARCTTRSPPRWPRHARCARRRA